MSHTFMFDSYLFLNLVLKESWIFVPGGNSVVEPANPGEFPLHLPETC